MLAKRRQQLDGLRRAVRSEIGPGKCGRELKRVGRGSPSSLEGGNRLLVVAILHEESAEPRREATAGINLHALPGQLQSARSIACLEGSVHEMNQDRRIIGPAGSCGLQVFHRLLKPSLSLE